MKIRSLVIVAALFIIFKPVDAAAQHGTVISGTVRNAANGNPVSNATVRSGRRIFVTGGDGTYNLRLDSIPADVVVTAVGFAPVARIVSLNDAASAIRFDLDPSAVSLDEVVTIGSRTAERTVTGSTAPVDVISSQLLESTGVQETWQQIQRLVPSVFGPHIPIADNGMRPITLRGMPPHHALVLVNGKRRHPASMLLAGPSVPNTTFTDLNTIPASAIDRIEILRDGASAQYGSDAISGVVNIVLKSGVRRELRTSLGQVFTSEGGRSFRDGQTLNVDGTFGMVARNGAQVTISGELMDRDGTNRAYPDQRPQYFTGDPRNSDPPRVSTHFGDASVRNTSFILNATVPIGGAEAYAFGGAAHKSNVAPDAFFRRAMDRTTVRAIFPDGFLPRIESGVDDIAGVAGIRGGFSGWRYDLGSSLGGNRIEYHVKNSNNVSLGDASPVNFYIGRLATKQWTTNLDLSRDFKVASVPLTVASGAEFRLDKYQIRAGDGPSWQDGGVRILDGPFAGQPAAVGSQGMLGFRPIDEASPHRTSVAAYLEVDARPFERLLLQSAARGEHYSDFGSTSDGKLAARLSLFDGIALRGSLSTGFRAPSLVEEYFSNSRSTFIQFDGSGSFRTVRLFPVATPEARLMGATDLRPETSINRSAGLIFNRKSWPLITADFYEIKLDDRIGLIATVTDTSLIRVFEEKGLRGIGGGSYFANKMNTRTRGIDVVTSHAFLLSRAGVLRILGGYNHNRTRVTHVASPPPQLAAVGAVLFNRTTLGYIEQGQPRQTITLGVNYNAGRLGLNVNNVRSGPTAQLDGTLSERDQHVRPSWLTDLRASYQVRPRWQIAASAVNLFDVYPNDWWDFKDGVKATAFANAGIFRYPAALSAAGMNGRTLYVHLSYR